MLVKNFFYSVSNLKKGKCYQYGGELFWPVIFSLRHLDFLCQESLYFDPGHCYVTVVSSVYILKKKRLEPPVQNDKTVLEI